MIQDKIIDQLRGLPKADLHVHFEGTVSWDMLVALADKNDVCLSGPISFSSKKQIAIPSVEALAAQSFNSFESFVLRYLKTTEAICFGEDVLTIGRSYLESAASQGIVHTEMRFTPCSYQLLGRELGPFFEGLRELSNLAAKEYQASLVWIFDIARNSPAPARDTLTNAVIARELGVTVVGLDLAGNEESGHLREFEQIFQDARSLGFSTGAHAGEGTNSSNILDTIKYLKPSRIGHGVSAAGDNICIQALIEQGITLEVCPHSNIALGCYRADNHPLKQLLESNVSVVLCSDDPGIFGKSLLDNYLFAFEQGVSVADLKKIAQRSIKLCEKQASVSLNTAYSGSQ